MIHVAEFNGGQIRLEISNQDEFIRRVKAEARKQKKSSGTWKIYLIGSDKVTAPIQKLIEQVASKSVGVADPAIPSTPPSTNGSALAHHEPKAKAAAEAARAASKPVRPRPGGPLKDSC
jgi:hypothetical protein